MSAIGSPASTSASALSQSTNSTPSRRPYQCRRICASQRVDTMSDRKRAPWAGIISDDEQKAYRAAGFGRKTGLGKRPALMIIDVQYRTVGTKPRRSGSPSRNFRPPAARSAGRRSRTSQSCSRRSARRTGRCSIRTSRRSRPSTRAACPTRSRRSWGSRRTATTSWPRSRRGTATSWCRRSIRARSSARRSRATWSSKAPTRSW